MWTFIKLNTRDGRMWQVQYDVKGSERFEVNLNTTSFATKEEERDGRFTLYNVEKASRKIDGKTVSGYELGKMVFTFE